MWGNSSCTVHSALDLMGEVNLELGRLLNLPQLLQAQNEILNVVGKHFAYHKQLALLLRGNIVPDSHAHGIQIHEHLQELRLLNSFQPPFLLQNKIMLSQNKANLLIFGVYQLGHEVGRVLSAMPQKRGVRNADRAVGRAICHVRKMKLKPRNCWTVPCQITKKAPAACEYQQKHTAAVLAIALVDVIVRNTSQQEETVMDDSTTNFGQGAEMQCHKSMEPRAVLQGKKILASERQHKRTFTGTPSASWSWDYLYFKGWRLAAVGGWQLAVGGSW